MIFSCTFRLILIVKFCFFGCIAYSEILPFLPENVPPVSGGVTPAPPDEGSTLDSCPPEGVGHVTTNLNDSSTERVIINKYYPTNDFNAWNRPSSAFFEITATTAGWYHLYRAPGHHYSESGDSQRNESFFLSIPNGRNVEGKPADIATNCHGWVVAKDFDNDPLDPLRTKHTYLGTFYLNAGPNPAYAHHFCKLHNEMACDHLHDTDIAASSSGYYSRCFEAPLADMGTVNSTHIAFTAICALPDSAAAPGNNPIPRPSFSENFTGRTVGSAPLGMVSMGIDGDWGSVYVDSNPPSFPAARGSGAFSTGLEFYSLETGPAAGKFVVAPDPDDSANLALRAPDNNGYYFSYLSQHTDDWKMGIWRDYQYTGRIKLTHSSPTRVGIFVYGAMPYSGEHFSILTRNGGTYQLRYYLAQTYSAPGHVMRTNSGFFPQVDVWHYFKIEVRTLLDGTEYRAKFWNEGDSEPAGWQIDAIYKGASYLNNGTAGIIAYQPGGDGAYFDDLTINPL